MYSIDDASRDRPGERLNYFNYFTEVEEEFVRRRGKPLLISPMDWALIESWKNAGIPLHVVLRAINQAFDSYDSRTRKYRKVNSVFYCEQEVESMFAEYRLAQVGAPAEPSGPESAGPESAGPEASRRPASARAQSKADSVPPFPRAVLLDFIARSDVEFEKAASRAAASNLSDALDIINRARSRLSDIARNVESASRIDGEALERDFDNIDRMMLESFKSVSGGGMIEAITQEAHSQLQPYRAKMDKAIYAQTVENFVARRLREMHQVPRLSLFYI